jgi:hypothetical protein
VICDTPVLGDDFICDDCIYKANDAGWNGSKAGHQDTNVLGWVAVSIKQTALGEKPTFGLKPWHQDTKVLGWVDVSIKQATLGEMD